MVLLQLVAHDGCFWRVWELLDFWAYLKRFPVGSTPHLAVCLIKPMLETWRMMPFTCVRTSHKVASWQFCARGSLSKVQRCGCVFNRPNTVGLFSLKCSGVQVELHKYIP